MELMHVYLRTAVTVRAVLRIVCLIRLQDVHSLQQRQLAAPNGVNAPAMQLTVAVSGVFDSAMTERRVAGLSSYLDQPGTSMTLFAPTNTALAAAGLDVCSACVLTLLVPAVAVWIRPRTFQAGCFQGVYQRHSSRV